MAERRKASREDRFRTGESVKQWHRSRRIRTLAGYEPREQEGVNTIIDAFKLRADQRYGEAGSPVGQQKDADPASARGARRS